MQQQQHQPQQQQLVKKERSSSDDSAMMKQVFATHSPDGRDMDLEPILHVIEETLLHAINPASFEGVNDGTHDGHVKALAGEEKAAFTGFDDVDDSLAHVIHKISCEFSCKCSGGADANASTIKILNMLSGYSWEAKMVISLGAFSINVGEFWLVAKLLLEKSPVAKSVALFKQLPNIIEHYKSLEPPFNTVNLLIKSMLEVTKCIIAFKKLPYQSIQDDRPPKSTALTQIPIAAYLCIKSMVACAAQLSMNYESTSDARVLPSLARKLHNIHEHLKELIEEKKDDAYFLMLTEIFKVTHQDNLDIIKALFCAKNDVIYPLIDGSSKDSKYVNVNVLLKKHVLLLISDLDISDEEVLVLTDIYIESRKQHLEYEVVWVPVVDDQRTWNDSQPKLEQLRSKMKWHMLQHPELLKPAVVRYLKQEWQFEKKPILVVLDKQGRVTSPNALHMVWIWGNTAYPFTSIKENALWKDKSWTLELLVDSKDRSEWNISEEKYICLYGGDNLDWIKDFTELAAKIAKVADIQMQMVYYGKSGTKEKIKKISEKIFKKISEKKSEEKLSYTWPDPTRVWYYWTRLESMLYSKMQHSDRKSYEKDPIMKEVMTMMSFDGSDQGWALICKGSNEMARANAGLALESLNEYAKLGPKAKQIDFVLALKEYLKKLHTSQHCIRLILPWISGGIPEVVVCTECGRKMEKFFMFRCCTE